MADAIPLLTYAAEWGLLGIILYFVVGWIPMPDAPRRVAQGCLILVGVLSVLAALLGAHPRVPLAPLLDMPSLRTPSIIR